MSTDASQSKRQLHGVFVVSGGFLLVALGLLLVSWISFSQMAGGSASKPSSENNDGKEQTDPETGYKAQVRRDTKAESLRDNFLGLLIQKKWDEAYELTSVDYQSQVSLPEFRALVNEYAPFHGNGKINRPEEGTGTAKRMEFTGSAQSPTGIARFTLVVLETEKGLRVGKFTIK